MNVPDTWRAAHCIECYGDAEHCPTCGCHDNPETVAPQQETST